MRNFNRILSDPEKTPCATATETPNKRPLQTSMSPAMDEQIGTVIRMLWMQNCVKAKTNPKDLGALAKLNMHQVRPL